MDTAYKDRCREIALELVVKNSQTENVVEQPKRVVDAAAILAAFLIGETK